MAAPGQISHKTAALICAIAALLWTAKNFSGLQIGWASRSWPKAPATIVESTFAPRIGTIRPIFAYRYTIKGRTYTGSNYDSFGPARGRRAIDQFVVFRPDKSIEISYSPANPALSVIVPGYQMRHVTMLGSCLLLWYFAAQLFWKALKSARPMRPGDLVSA